MRSAARAAYVLCAWLCVVFLAHGQAPDPPAPDQAVADEASQERAREHFRMGVSFYREGNFAAALIEFQRAYAQVQHYKILFNLGQTLIELQDYGAAVDSLRAYLERGGGEVTAERRREVEAMIAEQQARLGELVLTCDQDGAEVYIDDRSVGTTPLTEPLRVGAGRRRLKLIKQDFLTVERTIDLAAGDALELEIDMQPVAEEGPAPFATAAADYPMVETSGTNIGAWVAGTATVVLGAGAVTMALLTADAEDKLASERERETTRGRLQDLGDEVETRALVTDIALGATVISAALTAVFLLTAEDAPDFDAQRSGSLRLTPAGAGLGMTGAF